MIDLYCRRHHGDAPCLACAELRDYAEERARRCPFGEAKPVCSDCRVHCYRGDRREQIRRVMRFAGPRMILRHPVLTLRHWIDRKTSPPVP